MSSAAGLPRTGGSKVHGPRQCPSQSFGKLGEAGFAPVATARVRTASSHGSVFMSFLRCAVGHPTRVRSPRVSGSSQPTPLMSSQPVPSSVGPPRASKDSARSVPAKVATTRSFVMRAPQSWEKRSPTVRVTSTTSQPPAEISAGQSDSPMAAHLPWSPYSFIGNTLMPWGHHLGQASWPKARSRTRSTAPWSHLSSRRRPPRTWPPTTAWPRSSPQRPCWTTRRTRARLLQRGHPLHRRQARRLIHRQRCGCRGWIRTWVRAAGKT